MVVRGVLCGFALCTLVLRAQPPVPARLADAPPPVPVQIHGVVVEAGTDAAIAGAQVVLRHPVIAPNGRAMENQQEAVTGSSGRFSFYGDAAGRYAVTATHDGYAVGRTSTTISSSGEREMRVELGRAPVILGRIEDAETREPVRSLRIAVENLRTIRDAGVTKADIATDDDGAFRFQAPEVGAYVVHVIPKLWTGARARTSFTEEDANAVDLDYESTYWPGGGTQSPVAAVTAASGAQVNVGTLAVRKVPYYRARVTFPAEGCIAGMRYETRVMKIEGAREETAFEFVAVCGKDVLLTGLAPGAYRTVFRPWKVPDAGQQWAFEQFVITGQNVALRVRVAMGADVEARVVMGQGSAAKPMPDVRVVLLEPVSDGTGARREGVADDEGRARLINVPQMRWGVAVDGLPAGWVVREVRYRGVPQARALARTAASFAWDGGGSLEIEVTDRTGAIEGSVLNARGQAVAARVVLMAAGQAREALTEPWAPLVVDAADGSFRAANLAEGDYRVLVVPAEQSLRQVLVNNGANARVVRVKAGESARIELEQR